MNLPGLSPPISVGGLDVLGWADSSGAAGTMVVTMPSGLQPGELLLGLFGSAGTKGLPAGWTLCTGLTATSNPYGAYRIADGTEGASISISGASGSWAGTVFRIVGEDPTGAVESGSITSGTSTSPNMGAYSPSWGASRKTLMFQFNAGVTGTITYPSDCAIVGKAIGGSTSNWVCAGLYEGATIDPALSWTLGTSQTWNLRPFMCKGLN